ncbi:hypothetical protein H1C71_039357, partial [Ictidomys tridecemlineatus]
EARDLHLPGECSTPKPHISSPFKFIWRQSLARLPRLDSNLLSPCLHLPSSWVVGVRQHALLFLLFPPLSSSVSFLLLSEPLLFCLHIPTIPPLPSSFPATPLDPPDALFLHYACQQPPNLFSGHCCFTPHTSHQDETC